VTGFSHLFLEAFTAVKAQKLRAGLTILGVMVGVAGIVALMGIGEGVKRQILAQAEQYGPDMLVVTPRQSISPEGAKDVPVLTLKDLEGVRMGVDGITDIAPMVSRHAFVRYKNRQRLVPVIGSWNEWGLAQNTKIISGRFFNPSEKDDNVCILGFTPYKKLVGMDPVGSSVFIDGVAFRVVGLFERKGGGKDSDINDIVLIPVRAARLIVSGGESLSGIVMRARNRQEILKAQVAVHDVLRRRHGKDDFTIRSQEAFLSIAMRTGQAIRMFLLAVAFAMLFVGGIGVMNTMFVAVKDRTREIGIRRAVGASRTAIRNQFLSEAVLICTIGCLAGLVLGVAGGYVVGLGMFGSAMSSRDVLFCILRPAPVLTAVVAAVATGVVAGWVPASRASTVQPAEALRYE
jgi:putative ABC transport system permease protein